MKVKICSKSKCFKNGGNDLYDKLCAFSKDLNKYLIDEKIDAKSLKIKKTTCQSNCKKAPSVKIKSSYIDNANLKKVKKFILEKYKLENLE